MGLLTDLEIKHLQYLAEILDYGASHLKIAEGFESRFDHLQHFLLSMHAGVHNFAEAIYILCKDSRPNAASVLLRSLFEAFINIDYIKQGDTEKKLALFSREGFKVRGKIARDFENFIKKYPHKENTLSLLNRKTLGEMKEFAYHRIKGIEKVNNLSSNDYYSNDLRFLCEEIDKAEVDLEKRGDKELSYMLIYRYLSPLAHLNCLGLEYFADNQGDSIIYNLGQKNGIHIIVVETYLYYFNSMNNLFEEKIIDGIFDDKYKLYCDEIKNTKIN
jgi:hypothetical protein